MDSNVNDSTALEPLFLRAREIEQRWRLSWWDSMVAAVAQLQGCALLQSEDQAGLGGAIAPLALIFLISSCE